MLDRGCNEKKIESILPFLVSGFGNAQKQAIDNIKEARANWKATTGEVYGDKKAVNWKAVKPEVDQSAVASAEKALADISTEFDAENQRLGALQTEFNNANKSEAELNGLRAKSGQIERIETKLSIDRKELALITVKYEDAKFKAQGSTPENIAAKCPCCESELFWNGKELVKREGDLQGDEDAVEQLPELERALTLLKNSVANGERDLADAKYAKNKLIELEKESKEVISEERINQLKEKLDALRTKRKEAQDAIDLINKNVKLANVADDKTKKASGYHDDVQEWDAISSALATDGIPGEILKTAMTPINERLAKTSAGTGLKQVVINDDMTISYGGKPYGLASQSAKWRVNVMIAEAISHITSLRFLMVDEFDLLDAQSRSVCMKWLVNLAKNKEIETALVFGTLKELPEKLPPLTSAYWIQGGVIAQDTKAKAA